MEPEVKLMYTGSVSMAASWASASAAGSSSAFRSSSTVSSSAVGKMSAAASFRSALVTTICAWRTDWICSRRLLGSSGFKRE